MTTQTASFTSLDAHNGCRALFNGAKGWAYIGPAGSINPADFPGTVSYDCKRTGAAAAAEAAAAAAARAATASTRYNVVTRKTSTARSAYLDAADLEHLVHEAERVAYPASGCAGAEEEEDGTRRRGRPIVLTLQAILAATATSQASAAGAGGSHSLHSAATAKDDDEEGEGYDGERRTSDVNDTLRVSDHAQFPPLVLRGVSSERNGLFLAAPITMVKQPPAAGWAGGDSVGETGQVSCSEAVAAMSAAEAAQVGSAGGVVAGAGAEAGQSRVGWWLRWSTAGADVDDDFPPADTAAAVTASSTETAATPATASNASVCPSLLSVTETGVSGVERAEFCEATGALDGWQILSPGTSLEPTAGDWRQGPMEITSRTRTVAAAAAGSAWALVTGNWSGKREKRSGGVPEGRSEGDVEEDAASWCDCAGAVDGVEADEVGTEEDVTAAASVERDGGVGSEDTGGGAVAEVDDLLVLGDSEEAKAFDTPGADRGVLAAAVTIEVALQRAANSTYWAASTGDNSTDQGVQSLLSPAASPSDPPLDRDRHAAKENVPISFRDMLMAPSATGATQFSESPLMRARGRSVVTMGAGASSSSGPTLVDGGSHGGAVYLWRKAAAGEGGKAAERVRDREDEDPYYARKRVGAFAFKTKPRGKAHK